MMLIKTVTPNMFYQEMSYYGFSEWACNALFEHFENGLCEPTEFDPVAINCEYNESSLAEFIKDYDIGEDIDPILYLEEHTLLVDSIPSMNDEDYRILYVQF